MTYALPNKNILTVWEICYKIAVRIKLWRKKCGVAHNVRSTGPARLNGIGESEAKRISAATYVISTKNAWRSSAKKKIRRSYRKRNKSAPKRESPLEILFSNGVFIFCDSRASLGVRSKRI